jgi:bifunctional oligoribonuclease and PAP phosphatase NrnA
MNIKHEIKKMIESYDTIIIHRHQRPDMDAIGSQYGLSLLLKENYKDKKIYVVGDLNDMSYLAEMDDISDDTYNNALAIITDVSVTRMMSDSRYNLAKDIIIIDHHQNDTDLDKVSIFYKDSSFSSAAEMIIGLAKTFEYRITKEAATYLYGGMVTDTGRFMYMSNPSQTFELASFITKFDPDIQPFYDFIYTETLKKRKTKHLFQNFELTKNNVAYRKNDLSVIEESGLDFQSISRGMVNQMAGIIEVPIWANFTEDVENNVIVGEFRSRGVTIVDIVKKYGGGGHNNACGASLKDWNEVENILKDFDERAELYAKNTK